MTNVFFSIPISVVWKIVVTLLPLLHDKRIAGYALNLVAWLGVADTPLSSSRKQIEKTE